MRPKALATMSIAMLSFSLQRWVATIGRAPGLAFAQGVHQRVLDRHGDLGAVPRLLRDDEFPVAPAVDVQAAPQIRLGDAEVEADRRDPTLDLFARVFKIEIPDLQRP